MKKMRMGGIIIGILMIFLFSSILPSCSTTRMSLSESSSRKSLMMKEGGSRYKGKKTSFAKASRSYKKSKKRSNYYKKKKHKYR